MNSQIEKKPWGTCETIVERPDFAAYKLSINRGGFCSLHRHRWKSQNLRVLSGVLKIRKYWGQAHPDDGKGFSEELYEAGHFATCGVLQFHQFEALDPVAAIEVYYPGQPGWLVDPQDIDRIGEGGCR